MLEHERLKARFYADMSGESQFEYSVSPAILTLSSAGAAKVGLPEKITNPLTDARIMSLIVPESLRALTEAIHATTPEKPVSSCECQLETGDGPRWVRMVFRTLWSEEKLPRYTGVIGKAVDIHEEREHLSVLKWMSTHDSLTGLCNHSVARTRIQDRLARNPEGKYVMLIFDMDGFKRINDTRGHLFGDQALTFVAQRLRQSVRRGDIVARVGGDEFLIFLEYKESEDAIVQRIFHHLTCRFEDQDIFISMGAARTEELGNDYERLFRAADQALYAVKGKGGNQVCYYDEKMKDMLSAVSAIDAPRSEVNRKERPDP